MKRPPQYPDYKISRPIIWSRWGALLAVLWLIGALVWWGINTTQQQIDNMTLGFISLVFPTLLWALAISTRYLILQIGLVNRRSYQRSVDQQHNIWWNMRSKCLAVQQVYVIGPLGNQERYQKILSSPIRPPSYRLTSPLRYPLLLTESACRQQGLAEHLALQLLTDSELEQRWPHLAAIYWFGDQPSYLTFIQTLKLDQSKRVFDQHGLNNIDDLDHLIDHVQRYCQRDQWILCAGVESMTQSTGSLPAGEAGFAWVVGQSGVALLHRAEQITLSANEQPSDGVEQLQRYAGLSTAPEYCLAMEQQSMESVLPSGWSAIEHILAPYWGDIGAISPFIGMSMSLMHTLDTQKSSGWMSQDTKNTLVIGVTIAHVNR